jgi:hypothetical protein
MPGNTTRSCPTPSTRPRPLPVAEVVDLTDEQSARQSPPLRTDNEVEEMHMDLTEDEPRRNVRQIGLWEEV